MAAEPPPSSLSGETGLLGLLKDNKDLVFLTVLLNNLDTLCFKPLPELPALYKKKVLNESIPSFHSHGYGIDSSDLFVKIDEQLPQYLYGKDLPRIQHSEAALDIIKGSESGN